MAAAPLVDDPATALRSELRELSFMQAQWRAAEMRGAIEDLQTPMEGRVDTMLKCAVRCVALATLADSSSEDGATGGKSKVCAQQLVFPAAQAALAACYARAGYWKRVAHLATQGLTALDRLSAKAEGTEDDKRGDDPDGNAVAVDEDEEELAPPQIRGLIVTRELFAKHKAGGRQEWFDDLIAELQTSAATAGYAHALTSVAEEPNTWAAAVAAFRQHTHRSELHLGLTQFLAAEAVAAVQRVFKQLSPYGRHHEGIRNMADNQRA